MNSILPQWLIDISSISSIVGFVITGFLLWEAREIKNSFLRRARLPEVSKELIKAINNISKGLKSWKTEKNYVNEQYGIVRGLLENIAGKLPDDEKKQVLGFIKSLKKRKYIFWLDNLVIDDENMGWALYTELSRITTRLVELHKDAKWD